MIKLSLSVAVFLISLFSYSQCGSYALSILSNNATCYQFCDGSLTVTTSGGNGGDTFTITDSLGTTLNGGGSNTANSLCAGWYYVFVEDNMGCLLEDSVYIDQPDEMMIDYMLTHPLCYGDSTGTIVIDTVFNYTGNFNQILFFWNPNINNVSFNSLTSGPIPNGTYMVTVNDENGCSKGFNFDITSPPALQFSDFGGDDCTSGNDGVVYMSAAGGSPSYSYTWNDLSTANSSSNTTWGGLGAGCYEGVVMDANGCDLKDTVCIGCLDLTENSLDITHYPNPFSDFHIININSADAANIQIADLNGKIVYTDEFYKSGLPIKLNHLVSGCYILTVSSNESVIQKFIVKK